jgi:hypothetical protein
VEQRLAVLLGEKHVEDVVRQDGRVRPVNPVLQEHHAGNLRIMRGAKNTNQPLSR